MISFKNVKGTIIATSILPDDIVLFKIETKHDGETYSFECVSHIARGFEVGDAITFTGIHDSINNKLKIHTLRYSALDNTEDFIY